MHQFKSFLLILVIFSFVTIGAHAQEGQGASQNDILQESIADLTLVAFAGLGGAILGLSTLSFTEEPGEHLDNVVVGGAIGIIVGVGVVAYRQAIESSQQYNGLEGAQSSIDFNTSERRRWAATSHQKYIPPSRAQVGWQFSF